MLFERLARKNDVFPIYIEKEQIAGSKNDQAMRKSPGHVPWVRALKLKTCNVDPPLLYKIKFVTELIKWFFYR
jgi:hypothetical protein